MVQPAGDAHGVGDVPPHHEPARLKHPADHAGAGLVHVGKRRVVAGAQTVLQEVRERGGPPAGLLDHAHVGEAVDGGEVVVGGGFGRGEGVFFQKAEFFAQLQGQAEAQGVEGMFAAEAVGFQGRVVDDGGSAGHGWGGQSTG